MIKHIEAKAKFGRKRAKRLRKNANFNQGLVFLPKQM